MKIIFTDTFKEKYNNLDQKIKIAFNKKIKLLFEHGLRYPSLRIHKLKGKLEIAYSLSINMNFRAVFYKKSIDRIVFFSIGKHDIYKDL